MDDCIGVNRGLGSTDRRLLQANRIVRAGRWCRISVARLLAAMSSWPHVVEVAGH